MLYFVLIGLVLASTYCRADERVERATVEQRLQKLENELEYGGKQYQPLQYINSKLPYRTCIISFWSIASYQIFPTTIYAGIKSACKPSIKM